MHAAALACACHFPKKSTGIASLLSSTAIKTKHQGSYRATAETQTLLESLFSMGCASVSEMDEPVTFQDL